MIAISGKFQRLAQNCNIDLRISGGHDIYPAYMRKDFLWLAASKWATNIVAWATLVVSQISECVARQGIDRKDR
jgi:hypothetical protein